jgi:hypothetical protein
VELVHPRCAGSAQGDRERSTAKLDAPGASQATESCKQQSSNGADGALAGGIGQRQPRPSAFSTGCAMLIVVRRGNARSACSLGFKPILSKRAGCRSSADGGVHAGPRRRCRERRETEAADTPRSVPLLPDRRASLLLHGTPSAVLIKNSPASAPNAVSAVVPAAMSVDQRREAGVPRVCGRPRRLDDRKLPVW